MSVVVAKVYEDRIEMAADSICTRGWSMINGDTTIPVKMVKHHDMILGGCGLAEETQLFFMYMKTHVIEEADEQGVLNFVLEFKRWKKEYVDDDKLENSYIIALQGKCFGISGKYVYEVEEYAAIGAGEDYARGALYMGATPEEAVKAACDLCVYVAEPIIKESIPRNADKKRAKTAVAADAKE